MINENSLFVNVHLQKFSMLVTFVQLITPPARRAWRSYKFASLDFSGVFFGVRSWAAAHG